LSVLAVEFFLKSVVRGLDFFAVGGCCQSVRPGNFNFFPALVVHNLCSFASIYPGLNGALGIVIQQNVSPIVGDRSFLKKNCGPFRGNFSKSLLIIAIVVETSSQERRGEVQLQ